MNVDGMPMSAETETDPCECDGLGFVAMVGGIQRCDLCKRYACDEDARSAARARVLKLRFPSQQQFLREEDLQALPNLYATEDVPLEQKVAQVKFFDPGGRWTFYAVEFDGVDQLFGWCVSALGADCDELTYASVVELVARRRPVGVLGGYGRALICMERDEHFQPRSLGELLKGRTR